MIKREGWAAAVGTCYRMLNTQTVLIGRYTVKLNGATIEGRLSEETEAEAEKRLEAGGPLYPFTWDEAGKCTQAPGGTRRDFDLHTNMRAAAGKR